MIQLGRWPLKLESNATFCEEIVKTPQFFQAEAYRVWLLSVVLIVPTALLLSSIAVAGEPLSDNSDSTANASEDEIQIVADQLITNDAEKFAEFSGDVRASQGSFVITSDRLRIYYQSAAEGAENQGADHQSIKRIIASGNVRATTDRFTAKSDRAEYDMQTQVVIFTGENSSLKSDKNILSGSKITLDRKTGQMKVESPSQQRVKAIFYPKQDAQKKDE